MGLGWGEGLQGGLLVVDTGKGVLKEKWLGTTGLDDWVRASLYLQPFLVDPGPLWLVSIKSRLKNRGKLSDQANRILSGISEPHRVGGLSCDSIQQY